MRVALISKALVVGAYQRKLELLARYPDLHLTALVPPFWLEGKRRLVLEPLHVDGYDLQVVPIALNGRYHLHFYPGLGSLLRKIGVQILHIEEEPYNFATFQATWHAQRIGARCLFFTWQNLPHRYPFPFSTMERYVLNRADHAIAGSRGAVEVLRAKGYQRELDLIPQFGVDEAVYRPAAPPAAGRPYTVGYIGRLVPEKGVDLLIRAVSRLREGGRLLVLGDGPEAASLRRLVERRGLQGRVRFERPIPSAQMPTHYHRLDLLVLPSRARRRWTEQFGRVLIEAMACGVPVIGSDAGAIPEVLGEAGLTFPDGDIQALSETIDRVRTDSQLASRLVQRGRERVLERFTQAQVAEKTYRVYQGLRPEPVSTGSPADATMLGG
ncbi:MAG: glycosyltransferase [Anaerolineae bacterium]